TALGRARAIGDEVGVRSSRDEADVLALPLVGHGKLERRGNRAHLGFAERPDGKQRPRELRLSESEQEVALVLVAAGRLPWREAVGGGAADGRVVAGGESRGAERSRVFPEGVELDVAVAQRARVRRAAGQIGRREGADHALLEALAQVDDVVRDAEPARRTAG